MKIITTVLAGIGFVLLSSVAAAQAPILFDFEQTRFVGDESPGTASSIAIVSSQLNGSFGDDWSLNETLSTATRQRSIKSSTVFGPMTMVGTIAASSMESSAELAASMASGVRIRTHHAVGILGWALVRYDLWTTKQTIVAHQFASVGSATNTVPAAASGTAFAKINVLPMPNVTLSGVNSGWNTTSTALGWGKWRVLAPSVAPSVVPVDGTLYARVPLVDFGAGCTASSNSSNSITRSSHTRLRLIVAIR